MSREASFYGQRAGGEQNGASGKYKGPNRRHQIRRSLQDRRQEIRFEMDREPRRILEGRREDDHTPKYY